MHFSILSNCCSCCFIYRELLNAHQLDHSLQDCTYRATTEQDVQNDAQDTAHSNAALHLLVMCTNSSIYKYYKIKHNLPMPLYEEGVVISAFT